MHDFERAMFARCTYINLHTVAHAHNKNAKELGLTGLTSSGALPGLRQATMDVDVTFCSYWRWSAVGEVVRQEDEVQAAAEGQLLSMRMITEANAEASVGSEARLNAMLRATPPPFVIPAEDFDPEAAVKAATLQ